MTKTFGHLVLEFVIYLEFAICDLIISPPKFSEGKFRRGC